MTMPSQGELPQHAIMAASFAETLARDYAGQGKMTRDLFVAFVALVSAQNQQICADSLTALESALLTPPTTTDAASS
jgi:hypothetical protein